MVTHIPIEEDKIREIGEVYIYIINSTSASAFSSVTYGLNGDDPVTRCYDTAHGLKIETARITYFHPWHTIERYRIDYVV